MTASAIEAAGFFAFARQPRRMQGHHDPRFRTVPSWDAKRRRCCSMPRILPTSVPLTVPAWSVRSLLSAGRRRPDVPTLTVQGAALYYEREGAGPVLLMIPAGPPTTS